MTFVCGCETRIMYYRIGLLSRISKFYRYAIGVSILKRLATQPQNVRWGFKTVFSQIFKLLEKDFLENEWCRTFCKMPGERRC